MAEVFTAVESMKGVQRAVTAWRIAFEKLGRSDHGFSKEMMWVADSAIWLVAKRSTQTGKFWNGLGVELNSSTKRKLVVEVNPPPSGSPRSTFQGVVARDAAGQVWILHRGRMTTKQTKAELSDFPELARQLKVKTVNVRYIDGSIVKCFAVANISRPGIEIVTSSQRFVSLCRVVRTSFDGEHGEADAQRLAALIEEKRGTYEIGAKGPITVERQHADVHEALILYLKKMGLHLASESVGAFGPDLYTTGISPLMLFEIKTGIGTGDITKAVGQLLVYDQVLGGSFRKIAVLPEGINVRASKILTSLGIDVLSYSRTNKGFQFFGNI